MIGSSGPVTCLISLMIGPSDVPEDRAGVDRDLCERDAERVVRRPAVVRAGIGVVPLPVQPEFGLDAGEAGVGYRPWP